MERRGKKELPRELKWFAVQAVTLDEQTGKVLYRSFPFWTFSMQHARSEILAMHKAETCPFTHIFQYGYLHQVSGKLSKYKGEKDSINIHTGAKK